jgi:sugar lactone lactonase YvrE
LPSAISLNELKWHGDELLRPECVLANLRGDMICSNWRGGVSFISAQGITRSIAARISKSREARPNGIAALPDGALLFADLGATEGGVFKLSPDGRIAPWLEQVDGTDLPPTNFPLADRFGRIWITVSTRVQPRADDYRPTAKSGFVVLVDHAGARIVADGLGYTNECAVSADGKHFYVNETFARRLSRFDIAQNGALSGKTTITAFGPGTFPDGLALDVEGHFWVTSIVSNRVLRVAPDGAQTLMLEDCTAEHLAWVEAAFASGTMGRPHLDTPGGKVLKNISSLAFGGPDMRTAYLGSLQGTKIASFRAPVAGVPSSHAEYLWQ